MGCEGSKPTPPPARPAPKPCNPAGCGAAGSCHPSAIHLAHPDTLNIQADLDPLASSLSGYVDDRQRGSGFLCRSKEPVQATVENTKRRMAATLTVCPLRDPDSLITEPIDAGEEGSFFKKVPVHCGTGCAEYGLLALDHFPSKSSIPKRKAQGCTLVVTLQKDEEGAQKVRKMCKHADIEWLQVDFWYYYHRGLAKELYHYVRYVALKVQAGGGVMIHCAAGIHRTGMFTYAVLLMLGYSPTAALESIREVRPTTFRRVGAHRIEGIHSLLQPFLPLPATSPDTSVLPAVPVRSPQSLASADDKVNLKPKKAVDNHEQE
eukprot:TRINITY_DN13175_c0_g1_i1.p1 TRINITY_DN13175_c0_g1~~TRINITY_DN13175_c0_g1_i1.p1  ORF type:complete len:375 (+),score=125.29 TRINITY_DN13175_c0_g1_i1:168-1127(+)